MKHNVGDPYFAYAAGLCVKCPKCSGLGLVTLENGAAYFKCTNCGCSATKERTVYRYDIQNQCRACGRYYRVDITEKSKQHFNMLHVTCPYCGYRMPGEVRKTAVAFHYNGGIETACEPFFGLELWFSASFDGKPVWALNREHLAYLIDYLSAGLREKPAMKTQADHLPTFMKTAKNRDRMVKLLRKMLQK